MINKDKVKVFNVLVKGTLQEKYNLLDEIRTGRDITMVSPLAKVLEIEKSRAVKKRILTVLNRLVILSDFRDVNIDIDFSHMLLSTDPFVRNGIAEIILNSEIPGFDFTEDSAR